MIEGIVFTALKGLVANGDGTYRCYAGVFPQRKNAQGEIELATTLPAIRYAVIDAVPIVDACGTDDGSTDDSRVQLDGVAATHGAALVLRAAMISAMDGLSPPFTRDQGAGADFDEQTRVWRATLDFVSHPSSETVSP